MSSAPVIHWIRPGVGYAPAAAASMLRLEAALGREHDSNSSYRDWDKQMGMFNAWNRWVAGLGPKPPHSRAIHPDNSMHCRGLADDSDDWVTPGYIALAAEHGWIRTAASDPTERHHFEYQADRDQHRDDPTPTTPTPAPAPEEEDEDVTRSASIIHDYEAKNIRGETKVGLIYPDGSLVLVGPQKDVDALVRAHAKTFGIPKDKDNAGPDRVDYVQLKTGEFDLLVGAWPGPVRKIWGAK